MVIAGALSVLVVLAAAVRGPWRGQFDTPDEGGPIREFTPAAASAGPFASTRPVPPPTGPPDLRWLLAVLVVIVLAAVAFGLYRLWLRFRRSDVFERETAPLGGVAMTLAAAEPDLPVLRRGVDAALDLLAQHERPTDAIVAAWLALEESAADSGVPRAPAATPTEFTVDVLRRTTADPASTNGLLRLYHRARFSAAGAVPADVEEARAHLAAIARTWAVNDA